MIALTHRRAVATMLVVTLLWSIAGVVSRHLDSARSFEVTFWRAGANGVALLLLLAWWRGPAALWRSIRQGGRTMWLSALCWCVLFTSFMLALTMTGVAGPAWVMRLARRPAKSPWK